MGSNLTKFEESIKGSLDGFELPYEPKQWDALEQRLDGAAQSGSSNYIMFAWAAAAVIAVTGLFLYFNLSDSAFESLMADQCVQIKEPAAKSRFKRDAVVRLDPVDLGAAPLNSSTNTDHLNAADSFDPLMAMNSVDDSQGEETNESNVQTDDRSVNNIDDDSINTRKTSDASDSNAIAFVSNIREACVGMIVEFQLSKGKIDGSYLWNFGDGDFSSQENPSHVYQDPGVYDITLSVRSEEDGQIHIVPMEKMIVINPKPSAEFGWKFINGPGEVPAVAFDNQAERATVSEWIFDDHIGTTEINPTRSFTQRGKHEIQLTVTNEFGCVDDVHHYISIEDDYKLNAEKVFTPNGDGKSDTFIPKALVDSKMRFKMTIYDDKQPIFETVSHRKPWGGNIGNEIAPAADYPWVVIIYNHKGEEQQYYSGTITITP